MCLKVGDAPILVAIGKGGTFRQLHLDTSICNTTRSKVGNYYVQCSVASNGQCLSGGGICHMSLVLHDWLGAGSHKTASHGTEQVLFNYYVPR